MSKPKKYALDVKYAYTTFYYPSSPNHQRVLSECKMLLKELHGSKKEFFSRSQKNLLGTYLRRAIYGLVIKMSKDEPTRQIAQELLLAEQNDSIKSYNRAMGIEDVSQNTAD